MSFGREELVIRQRWEVISISNDIAIALWFIVGSVLFFHESTTTIGTWFFLLGSIELLIRPAIRLARRIHLQRIRPHSSPPDDSNDY
ncbi:YrhK family protein [Williamsia muralis]|uniref:YrhK family protein n=1 Tax=Williamsia marianensis TaxID=85044 RepID=UPI000417319A|nr:YrhK family protein [Williamsia muralis]